MDTNDSPQRSEARTTGETPPGGGVGYGRREGFGESVGDQIGAYRLTSVIGEGGFGVVWLAERREPMLQRVALKIIKPGMDSKAVVARFEQERQALAVMDHPNVARVFDGGVTPGGRPYFVMEYVHGEPITGFCDRKQLSIAERLGLFISVCEAVQHAHTKGIIHRDIKPSNVLVEEVDGRPVAKVIDFGVAKATSQIGLGETIFTHTGVIIGTPEYMSPEQAGGEPDIDTRTDVYSLGVLLYELLTGLLPFDARELRRAGYAEIQRIIREVEPPRPSTRVSEAEGRQEAEGIRQKGKAESTTIAENRKTRVGELVSVLRRELEWVPLKAMRKAREERYRSPAELADDLRRYLDGRPLIAGPESRAYRAKKFVRRNRGAVAATGAIAAALVLATGVSVWFGLRESVARERESEQRAEAERQKAAADKSALEASEQRKAAEASATAEAAARKKAESINEFIRKALVSSDPNQGGSQGMLVAEAMDRAVKEIDGGAFKSEPEVEGELLLTVAQVLNGNAQSQRGLELAERASDILVKLHSGDSEEVASSLSMVADCLDGLTRFAEALPKHEAALEMRRRLLPGDRQEVATGLNNVALCLHRLSRYQEALSTHEAALEMRRRLFAGDHSDIAESLGNLGFCLQDLSRWKEALPNFEHALEMRQRLVKGDDPNTARCLNNLAVCLNTLRETEAALSKHLEALAMRQRVFKGDHPDIANSLDNTGYCLGKLGRFEEALEKIEDGLNMRQRLFQCDHADVARSLGNIAGCLEELGRSEEALPKHEAALAMYRRMVEGDSQEVAMSLHNVAYCLDTLGRSDEALPKYEAALEMRRRIFPSDHQEIVSSLYYLAIGLSKVGRFSEALPKFEGALAMLRRMNDGDQEDIGSVQSDLAGCLESLDRWQEALKEHEAALEMRRRLFNGDHQSVAQSLAGVSRCRLRLNDLEGAEKAANKSVAIYKRLYPKGHPKRAVAIGTSALVRHAQGKGDEARALITEAEEMVLAKEPVTGPNAKAVLKAKKEILGE